MVVGGTRSLDLPPCSGALCSPSMWRLFWVVAAHRIVMVTFTLSCSSLSLLRHPPHTHLLAMGLNVAKCNLGEVKRDYASQWSPLLIICGVGLGLFQGPSIFTALLLSSIRFAHVVFACSCVKAFFAPSPSLPLVGSW